MAMLPDLAISDTQFEYSKMAPLSQYTMDKNAEITLAETAAPPAISRNATVLVLAPHGYLVGKTGSNGFTCIVERGCRFARADLLQRSRITHGAAIHVASNATRAGGAESLADSSQN